MKERKRERVRGKEKREQDHFWEVDSVSTMESDNLPQILRLLWQVLLHPELSHQHIPSNNFNLFFLGFPIWKMRTSVVAIMRVTWRRLTA